MKRNRPSPVAFARRARRTAFTLIELLVVISVIALLVSILMPCLQRARKQAGSVGCRANLHQWGNLYATYTSENDGYLPLWGGDMPAFKWYASWWRWTWEMLGSHSSAADQDTPDRASFAAIKDLLRCPVVGQPQFSGEDRLNAAGGTFLPWHWWFPEPPPGFLPGWYLCSSYHPNPQAHSWPRNKLDLDDAPDELRFMWMTSAVKNAATAPVFFDCAGPFVRPYSDKNPPPECDAIPTVSGGTQTSEFCFNRHEGGVNYLFLDWSVRKVGLKELWTLKWHTQYNTQGPWTKAGGVLPEDWPLWMRRFKDY